MAAGVFVTGAGTEIGKTLIACALTHQIKALGIAVGVLKPVISGFDADNPQKSDTGCLLTAAGQEITEAAIAAASPWRFNEPIAPNMAARRAGRPINFDRVVDHCRAALGDNSFTVIEGVGGVMAPITDTETVLDWMAALGLPTVVVAGSYLGAISHALTAVSVLAARAIPIKAVVVSESAEAPVPLAETTEAIEGAIKILAPGIPVVEVRRIAATERPWEAVPDLTALIDLS